VKSIEWSEPQKISFAPDGRYLASVKSLGFSRDGSYYDGGGRQNPHIDPEIRPLRLSAQEKQVLVTFLKSLSGSIREGRP